VCGGVCGGGILGGKSIPNKSQTDISAFIVLGLDNICHFLSIPGQPINPFHLNHPSYITLMPREVPLQGYLNTMGFSRDFESPNYFHSMPHSWSLKRRLWNFFNQKI